jgi:uncharacterized membrane-anchored protein YhcB (DUF1043 family)
MGMQNFLDLYQYAVNRQQELIAEADQHRLLTAALRTRATHRKQREPRERRAGPTEPTRDPGTAHAAGNLVACGSPAAAPAGP